jgi:hypothetical protein
VNKKKSRGKRERGMEGTFATTAWKQNSNRKYEVKSGWQEKCWKRRKDTKRLMNEEGRE